MNANENDLTPRQREVLDYYRDYFVEHWRMPTYREACRHFGIRSTNSIFDHLRRLAKKGYIAFEEAAWSGVRLTGYRIDLKRVAGGQG